MTDHAASGFQASPQQKRLYQLGAQQSRAILAVDLHGNLDEARLQAVLEGLVRRHEMLRTCFAAVSGMKYPLQVIAEEAALNLHQEDVGPLADDALNTLLDQQAAACNGEGLEAVLVSRGEGLATLLLVLPNLQADQVALTNVFDELCAAYALGSVAQEEPVQYLQFSEWQNEVLDEDDENSEFGHAAWTDWQEIPNPRPALPFNGNRQARYQQPLAAATSSRLATFCAQRELAEADVLFACWAVLLYHLGGSDRFRLGYELHGRKYEDLEAVIGPIAKIVPVALSLEAAMSFETLLDLLAPALDTAREWQDYFEGPTDAEATRDEGLNPFTFAYASYSEAIPAAGVTFTIREFDAVWEAARLRLDCRRSGSQSTLVLRARGLETGELTRLGNRFVRTLEGLLDQPQAALAALDVRTDEERALVTAFNDTAVPATGAPFVFQRFEQQVSVRGDQTALVFDEQCYSYAELNRRANQLAHHLIYLGAAPETFVGICLESSAEQVIALLAVHKSGAAYVPLDPALPPLRRLAILDDINAVAVLGSSDDSLGVPLLTLQEAAYAHQPPTNPVVGLQEANLAYALFTSGSTGRPKGVLIEHRQLTNYTDGVVAALGFGAGASYAMVSSFSADLGNTMLFPALAQGGTLHLINRQRVTDPEALAGYMAHNPIDYLKIVPSHLMSLLALPSAHLLPDKGLVLGGEAASPALLAMVRELKPECAIFNHYGPTETTVGVLTQDAAAIESGPLPLGRPLANSRVFLHNELGGPVARAVIGELCIAGSGLARGYLNCGDLTAAAFTPMAGGERLYRSGDLASFDAANRLFFKGRRDHQVKIRGFRIELGEIELRLKQHPDLRDAAVVLFRESNGAEHLVAYVVAANDIHELAGLDDFLRAGLPDYMVPAQTIYLADLPLNTNGKLDRAALPEPGHAVTADYLAPNSPIEIQLAGIWAEVLGLERVGLEDNFFQLGGDSILSIQIMARAKQAGLNLPPKAIFDNPTVASCLVAAPQQEMVGIGEATGDFPLTPIHKWFFEQEPDNPNHFNMSLLFTVRFPMKLEVLRQAAAAVFAHHDLLRARFRRDGSGWRATYAGDDAEISVTGQDLSTLDADQRSAELVAIRNAVQCELDLADGPLFRLVLFEMETGAEQRLLLLAHHLVTDGISWRVIIEDLNEAYGQLLKSDPVALPAKTATFKQWAELLQIYARSEAARADFDYWSEPHGVAALPRDNGAANLVIDERTVEIKLDAAATQTLLKQLPPLYGTQINDVLLTALVLAFQGWTGSDSLRVDMEGHGREDLGGNLDISRTVGWFTSHFPLTLKVAAGGELADVLKSVKEQLRQIPNKGIGYGILRYLADETVRAALAEEGDPEVSFNYLGQVDSGQARDQPMVLAPEGNGPQQPAGAKRSHLIRVNGLISAGVLTLSFSYSEALHQRATMTDLANRYQAELNRLLALSTQDCGGFTPSDFPLAGLAQGPLDRLMAGLLPTLPGNSLAQRKQQITDLYPLSPIQAGILFHRAIGDSEDVYFRQMSWPFRGSFNADALQRAWRLVFARHEITRAGFTWEDLEKPLQVIFRMAEHPFQVLDWSRLESAQQETDWRALAAREQVVGFDLAQAPVSRVILIKLAEDEHRLIWSYHHIIMDGWSKYRLLEEVFTAYEALQKGRNPVLAPARGFRDYISWLGAQDETEAREFWSRQLADFKEPTSFAGKTTESPVYKSVSYAMDAAKTKTLIALARSQQITVNTLTQGLVALLLAHYVRSSDLVFGTIVSGRPPDLEGVETIVGPLINSLPLRAKIDPEADLATWLRSLQAEHLAMRRFEHTPQVAIKKWSGFGQADSLFDTLLVFYNYPVDARVRDLKAGLEPGEVHLVEIDNFPLGFSGRLSDAFSVDIRYDSMCFRTATISRILANIGTFLELLLTGGPLQLGAILAQFEQTDKALLETEKDALRKISGRRRGVRKPTSGS